MNGGRVFFGLTGSNPTIPANQITIFANRALTITAENPQPLGPTGQTLVKIFVPARYSMEVQDEFNVQVFRDVDVGSLASIGISALINTGGTNAITAEADPTLSAYVDKSLFSLTILIAPTGPVTLNIDGVGAVAVKNKGLDIQAGQFPVNQLILVSYNATGTPVFELVSGGGDVVGPSLAVNENIAVFDLVSGKLIKDSGINIDATGNKNGSGTFVMTTATSTDSFVVTGLGFTPKHLVLMFSNTTLSMALAFMGTVTNSMCVFGSGLTSTTFRTLGNPVFEQGGAGNSQTFSLESLDADGFSLSNVKIGSPTGNVTISWLAFG